ncbi:MAG: hypothetical protein J6D31_06095 [Clostridia bacterium]|nr:hypothetical protein [Clostridia bacterium]
MGYWEMVGGNVIQSLKYMLFGMAGIFVITAIIIAGMVLLNKAMAGKPKNTSEE